MKNSYLILILLTYCSYGQENRTELKIECFEYFIRNTINNENYIDNECAKILKKDNNFIIRRNQNEYITFSISDFGRIDKQMFHIQNNDTISYSSYTEGKLTEKIEYNNKEIEVKEYLKNSLYHIKYSNYIEEWFLNNELIFKSKTIHLITNLNKELLKIIFKDELGINRYIIDYESSSSYHYNSNGKLIEKNTNIIKDPRFRTIAPNGESILVRLSPRTFNLKKYKN